MMSISARQKPIVALGFFWLEFVQECENNTFLFHNKVQLEMPTRVYTVKNKNLFEIVQIPKCAVCAVSPGIRV